MTAHLTPRRPERHAAGPLPDWHSTFSANADLTSNTVYARGVLDLLTAELLRGTVDVLLGAGRLDVRIDLYGLRHVDRAGLLLLSEIRHDLEHREGSLALVNPSSTVRQLLVTAGLPVAETTNEA